MVGLSGVIQISLYLASVLATRIVQTFIVVETLSTGLIELESTRTHALETAESVDALSWRHANTWLFEALVDI